MEISEEQEGLKQGKEKERVERKSKEIEGRRRSR